MKRYGNLYEKICAIENLREAHKNARKDKSYYKDVQMVDENPDYYLEQIRDMLINDTYVVSAYEYSVINDGGKERVLAKLPYFPDRIIQWAIMLQIKPIFIKTFCDHTCASIDGRGTERAFRLMEKYLKDTKGTVYCLKMDVKKFYPNIDHNILKRMLRRKFKDGRLLSLLDKIINSVPYVEGVPIGSYLSQFLANFYLSYLDHWMKEELKMKYVIRYMDDIIVLHSNSRKLHYVRYMVEKYLWEELLLPLKRNWQVFPVDARGVDFVGYRFYHGHAKVRRRTYKKFRLSMRRIERKQKHGISLSQNDWCSYNSYIGWILRSRSIGLARTYMTANIPSVLRYYKSLTDGKKNQKSRIKRYCKMLIRKGLIHEKQRKDSREFVLGKADYRAAGLRVCA